VLHIRTQSSRLVRASLTVACAAALIACGGGADAGGGRPPTGGPGATGGRPGGPPAADAIAVRVEAAAREPISQLYSTSATLRAKKRATVIARTRGVIRELRVEEGARVSEGQILAVLEDDEQRIAAERAKTAAEVASSELERQAGLLDQGLVSEDVYERLRRDAVDARHAAELAELELSRTRIRAPFSGVVLTRQLDVGATVSDGTAVYDLADVTPLEADVNIPERHVTRLEPGQPVRLTADASDISVDARIDRIAPSVDPATGTVKVTVAVEGGAGLRPGAFVRVDIVTATHDDALVVPRSALVAEGRRWHLYRLAEAGDAVEQLEVTLGFETGERVEVASVVTDHALEPGDEVVVVGASALSDGAAVHVVEDAATDTEDATVTEPADAA
jgi:membrane fusion protein (multidrug efflux system)